MCQPNPPNTEEYDGFTDADTGTAPEEGDGQWEG
jgi:hypothetical protein